MIEAGPPPGMKQRPKPKPESAAAITAVWRGAIDGEKPIIGEVSAARSAGVGPRPRRARNMAAPME